MPGKDFSQLRTSQNNAHEYFQSGIKISRTLCYLCKYANWSFRKLSAYPTEHIQIQTNFRTVGDNKNSK